jgi:hypothetical protein
MSSCCPPHTFVRSTCTRVPFQNAPHHPDLQKLADLANLAAIGPEALLLKGKKVSEVRLML